MLRLLLLRSVFLFLFFSVAVTLPAQIKMPDIFSDHMVLQRNKPVPVWGKANPGTTITVTFQLQTKTTVAAVDSNWMITLDPLTASATPSTLTIKGVESKTFVDILVGDVWLCSGQSNMEYPLDRSLKRYAAPKRETDPSEAEVKQTNKPDAVRYIYVERLLNKYPALPTKGWVNGNDTIVRYVSAIGYFFAKEIYEKTNVPIGIISTSWGGTRIEQWTPEWAYASSAVFKDSTVKPNYKIDGMHPGQMYKGMLEPMVPFAVKGVLWYQGESNCIIEDQETYEEKFKVFTNAWRTLFQDEQLPFYTVQIAPCLYSARKDPKTHSPELLPAFWEAQKNCTKIKNVHMVVTTDLVDNLKDIHPSYKWTVAHRLALQALHYTYGSTQLEAYGPTYVSHKRKKNTLVLQFSHTGKGLASSNQQPLNWFAVAGADGNFVPATAVIKNNTVVVSAKEIRKPKQVRFAWNETAQPNFVNSEGLPALPFRTH